jgi:glycosyltransferase involved in cell wall biosynthesis
MRLWLVTVGEPLPTDPQSGRLLRAGILSAMLAERGHEVVWWSSSFDHARKRHHEGTARTIRLRPNLTLRLLHGVAYRSNVSLARLVNHWQIAREFAAAARSETRPDLILTSFPTIELSVACTRYGKRHGVPVVVDIRDLWPDIFLELLPQALRPIGRLLLDPLFRWTRECCRDATAIVGITAAFVDWGLRRAGRAHAELDRDFPHGYTDRAPAQPDIEAAERFWDELGLAPSDFVACFFGILGRQVDLVTVIRAAAALSGSKRAIKVVVCGTGEKLGALQDEARGHPSVIFPGWVGRAQIWTLLRRSRVGLAPYVNELSFTQSIPNKAIEYLSAGLPIVTCLEGMLSDLVHRYNCGFVYRSGDRAALAALLGRLHDDDRLVRAAAERAQELYRARFVAENVYAQFAQHLEHIGSLHGGGSLARPL